MPRAVVSLILLLAACPDGKDPAAPRADAGLADAQVTVDAEVMVDAGFDAAIEPPPAPRLEVVAQLGGLLHAAVGEGTDVFAGVGHQVATFDLSVPRAPVERARTGVLGGRVVDLAVTEEGVLAAVSAGGLAVLERRPAGLLHVGTWVPPQPDTYFGPRHVTEVAALGDERAAVAVDGELVVLDLRDPAAPVEIARRAIPRLSDVAVVNGRILVGQGHSASETTCALQTLELTEAGTLEIVGTLVVYGHNQSITVDGHRAYVSNNGGFYIVDVSSATPVLLGSLPGGWLTASPSGSGELLAARMYEGVWRVDVSDPSKPQLGAQLSEEHGIEGVVAVGEDALTWTDGVAHSADVIGLFSVNTRLPGIYTAWDVELTGDHLVVRTPDRLSSHTLPLDPREAAEASIAVDPYLSGRIAAVRGLVVRANQTGLEVFDPADGLRALAVPVAPDASRHFVLADDATGTVATFAIGAPARVDLWQIGDEITALGSPGEVPFAVTSVGVGLDFALVGGDHDVATYALGSLAWNAPVDRVTLPDGYGRGDLVVAGRTIYRGSCSYLVDLLDLSDAGELLPRLLSDGGSCNPSRRPLATVAVGAARLVVTGATTVYGGLGLVDAEAESEGGVVHELHTVPDATDVAVSGRQLYVAAYGDGMLLVQIVAP